MLGQYNKNIPLQSSQFKDNVYGNMMGNYTEKVDYVVNLNFLMLFSIFTSTLIVLL